MRKIFFLILFFFIMALGMITALRFWRPELLRHYYKFRLQMQTDDNTLSFLETKNEASISLLLEILRSGETEKQISAMRILGSFNCYDATDLIFGLFASPYKEVRDTAVDVLTKLKTDKLIERARTRVTESEDFSEIIALMGFLQSVENEDFLPLVIDRFLAWDSPHRLAAARFVFGDFYYALIRKLHDKNRYIRGDAVLAFGFLGGQYTLPFVLDMVQDSAFFVRINTAYALGFYLKQDVTKEMWNAVRLLCSDKYSQVRKAMAMSLGHARVARATESLSLLSTDADWEVRYDAIRALISAGNESSIAEIVRSVSDPDPNVRGIGMLGLAMLGVNSEKGKIVAALDEGSKGVVASALRAIGLIGDSKYKGKVANLLGAFDPDVRGAAAEAMGYLGNGLDADSLRTMLATEEHRAVKSEIVIALSRLEPDKVDLDLINLCAQMYPSEMRLASKVLKSAVDQYGIYVLLNILDFISRNTIVLPQPTSRNAGNRKYLLDLLGRKDVIFRVYGGESAGKIQKISPVAFSMDIGGGISATINRELAERVEFNRLYSLLFFIHENDWIQAEINTMRRKRRYVDVYDRMILKIARDKMYIHLNQLLVQHVPLLNDILLSDTQQLHDFEEFISSQDRIDWHGTVIKGDVFLKNVDQRYPLLFREKKKEISLLVQSAAEYEEEGDLTSAVDAYRRILGIASHDIKSRERLASVLIKLEDYGSAVKELEQILRLDQSRKDIVFQIAGILRKSRRFEESLAVMEKYRRENSRDANILIEMGRTYKEMGDDEKALEFWTEANSLSPALFEPYFLLSLYYADTGDYRESLVWLNKGIALAPDNPVAKSFLGLLYLYAGDDDKALEECRGAVALSPENPDFLYVLGNVYACRGETDEAMDTYKVALRYSPGDVRIHGAMEKISAA